MSSFTYHLPLFYFQIFSSYFVLHIWTVHTATRLLYFSGEQKSVKTWFDRGAAMHGFQSAAQKVLQGKGLQGMKSYMQMQPAPQSSQCRDTQPCKSNPAEVSARSLTWLLDLKLSYRTENIQRCFSTKLHSHLCLRKHVHPLGFQENILCFLFVSLMHKENLASIITVTLSFPLLLLILYTYSIVLFFYLPRVERKCYRVEFISLKVSEALSQSRCSLCMRVNLALWRQN